MPGCPIDFDAPSHGTDSTPPIATVLHRTIGYWGGDYTVIKRGGLAHFLIGLNEGQWVQFADTDNYQWHAGGANDWSVGIEFSGMQGDPLTAWQLDRGRAVIHWLAGVYNIPLVYDDGTGGRNGPIRSFVAHNYVSEPDDQHTDRVNVDDWLTMSGSLDANTPVTPDPIKADNEMWMAYIKDINWCDVYYAGVLVDSFENTAPSAFGIGPKMEGYLRGGTQVTHYDKRAEYEDVRRRLNAAAA